ncbi:MAG: integrase core domain-containing protein [Bryobacteraceae bacterium]|jgi:transposase InsO family protein
MGIKQVLSAPRSPWQRAYVERVIGTIRRECLDHVIVLNQRDLSLHLQAFLNYYLFRFTIQSGSAGPANGAVGFSTKCRTNGRGVTPTHSIKSYAFT